jgi:subtilase family serine protease
MAGVRCSKVKDRAMNTKQQALRRVMVLLIVGTALSLAVGWYRSAAAEDGAASEEEVEQHLPGTDFARHPLFIKVHGRSAGGGPVITNATPLGYTPAQVQASLGLTGDGSGQTIAVVDAYDHPSILSDVNAFSSAFGLPLVCGTPGADALNCFKLTKATPQGKTRADAGWALEIALDVEWAHAVAPKAAVLLVEAKTNSFTNLFGAIDYAAQQGAAVISNSWGATEFASELSYDSRCRLAAAVCTFASGDVGNPGLYPAYSPYAVAVGGTTLALTSTGAVTSETAWSGSGGGVSLYEQPTAYQTSYKNGPFAFARRAIPDVSYNGNPSTGVAVYDSVPYQGQAGWFQVGGTSAGAPQWAAVIAVADQLRSASGKGPMSSYSLQASTSLYSLLGASSLFDIQWGSNGSCGAVCVAAAGYDAVAGLGSPRPGVDTGLASAP